MVTSLFTGSQTDDDDDDDYSPTVSDKGIVHKALRIKKSIGGMCHLLQNQSLRDTKLS